MHLVTPNDESLKTLYSWFDDNHSVAMWGGPDMHLPMTFESMQRDARLNRLASWFLVSDSGEIVGFGQYYNRVGRCHLCRLIVAPTQRGQRLGEVLIEELVRKGDALKLPEQSLFVHQDNPSAIKLYERIGFRETVYPGSDLDLTGIDYMVKS